MSDNRCCWKPKPSTWTPKAIENTNPQSSNRAQPLEYLRSPRPVITRYNALGDNRPGKTSWDKKTFAIDGALSSRIMRGSCSPSCSLHNDRNAFSFFPEETFALILQTYSRWWIPTPGIPRPSSVGLDAIDIVTYLRRLHVPQNVKQN